MCRLAGRSCDLPMAYRRILDHRHAVHRRTKKILALAGHEESQHYGSSNTRQPHPPLASRRLLTAFRHVQAVHRHTRTDVAVHCPHLLHTRHLPRTTCHGQAHIARQLKLRTLLRVRLQLAQKLRLLFFRQSIWVEQILVYSVLKVKNPNSL